MRTYEPNSNEYEIDDMDVTMYMYDDEVAESVAVLDAQIMEMDQQEVRAVERIAELEASIALLDRKDAESEYKIAALDASIDELLDEIDVLEEEDEEQDYIMEEELVQHQAELAHMEENMRCDQMISEVVTAYKIALIQHTKTVRVGSVYVMLGEDRAQGFGEVEDPSRYQNTGLLSVETYEATGPDQEGRYTDETYDFFTPRYT